MIFLFDSILFQAPFGALPETYLKYEKNINEKDQTFKCFDDSMIIPLSAINDNFQDCPDGSDEPGTPASGGYFYCLNHGSTPKIIPKWSVWDGICDCCDGSDERYNPHIIVPCFNDCQNPNSTFNDSIQKLLQIYSAGLTEQAELAKIGRTLYLTILEYNRNHLHCQKPQLDFGHSIISSLWKFTFRAPPPQLSIRQLFCYDHFINGYDYDDMNNIISLVDPKLKESNPIIEQMMMANTALYGLKYNYSNYFLTLFKNVKIPNGHILPLYSASTDGSLYKKGEEELKIEFLCNNVPKLIRCYGRNSHHCFFGSPSACKDSHISDLSHMTPFQLSETLKRIEGDLNHVF